MSYVDFHVTYPLWLLAIPLKDVIPLWSVIFCLGIQTCDVVLGTFRMQIGLNSLKSE